MATRTLTTRKGRSIETSLTDNEAFVIVERLADEGGSFAAKLAEAGKRWGLSNEQNIWCHILAVESMTPAAAAIAVDVSGINELFSTVGDAVKFPKITLVTDNGEKVQLSRAGDRAKHPGSINVTDGGRYGDNVWYGRIIDGEFVPSRSSTETVEALLVALSADPVGVAASYGKTTGHCCFCRKELTDDRSLAVGYGKKCSENYDMPWGSVELAVA